MSREIPYERHRLISGLFVHLHLNNFKMNKNDRSAQK